MPTGGGGTLGLASAGGGAVGLEIPGSERRSGRWVATSPRARWRSSSVKRPISGDQRRGATRKVSDPSPDRSTEVIA